MDKVDVWIQLLGVEPQPRRVARSVAALAWRTLRNVTADRFGSITVDPFQSTQSSGGFRRRRFLPADVLLHVDYTVNADQELTILAAPWMGITELWPQFSVVLLRTGTAGNETVEIRRGLAVGMATQGQAQCLAHATTGELQDSRCPSPTEVSS